MADAPLFDMNYRALGVFIDGYADLAENMGDKADNVRNALIAELQRRGMPEVGVKNVKGFVLYGRREERPCIIATTSPGVNTTAYIGQHGTDLYVAWRTFIRPLLNTRLLVITVGASSLLAFFLFSMLTGGSVISSLFVSPGEVMGSIFGSFLCSGIAFVAGLIIAFLGISAAGFLLRGNVTAFFFIEPHLFDDDDIAALSLSVHKSLLRALDQSGVDVTKLRIKERFKGGRKEDEV